VMMDENTFRQAVMPGGGQDGNFEPFLKVEEQPFPVAQD
jgi:hypothetical protein